MEFCIFQTKSCLRKIKYLVSPKRATSSKASCKSQSSHPSVGSVISLDKEAAPMMFNPPTNTLQKSQQEIGTLLSLLGKSQERAKPTPSHPVVLLIWWSPLRVSLRAASRLPSHKALQFCRRPPWTLLGTRRLQKGAVKPPPYSPLTALHRTSDTSDTS